MVYIDLEKLLKDKRKTRYWLVKELSSDYNTINKIINQETVSMKFDTIDKICDALDCDPSDLIKRDKSKKNVKY